MDNIIVITTTPVTPIRFSYLNNFTVTNFFCIQEEVVLENLKERREIYFVGENGDGKTLILQAILLAFKWHSIEHESKAEFTGKISDIVKSAGKNLEIIAFDGTHTYSYNALEIADIKIENRLEKIKALKNIFAYGVNRRYNSKAENKEQYGFMTLFDDSQYLESPTDWLLKTKLDATEENYQGIKLTEAVQILENLLDDNVKIKINGSKVKFIERGSEVPFEALSEGYKSVMTWVADLLSRLSDNQPEVKKLQDYQGIVLVDEISLHLHPKWEYQIVRKLRDWFPKIQFIMTTHSPVTVLGASEDAVFFKVYKENGMTNVSEPYTMESIHDLMANGVLTSPLFDLDSAAMRVAKDDIDTSDDFTYTLIHKQIAEQVKKLKSEGKVYISSEMLNEMVAKAIEKHKKAS